MGKDRLGKYKNEFSGTTLELLEYIDSGYGSKPGYKYRAVISTDDDATHTDFIDEGTVDSLIRSGFLTRLSFLDTLDGKEDGMIDLSSIGKAVSNEPGVASE